MATIASSSKSNVTQTPMQRCPCGTDHCYIELYQIDEDDDFADTNITPNNSSNGDRLTVPAPYVGQTFPTDEEALEYYNNFARCNGFLVRRERSKGNPDHPMGVYKRELVCHRAGAPLSAKPAVTKRQRSKKPERCRCEAQMVIKKSSLEGLEKWAVVNFSNVHNHDLLESNFVHCQPPYHHRYISQADRDRILVLAKGGCNVGLIIRALEMEKGIKTGQLTFSERDVKNFLHASQTVNPESEGVELLKYCRTMKEKNPDFRYEVSIMDNNKLEHIAWSYVESIRGYKAFGDVVIFDTGHHLCTYDRPILTWFGVDNNGNVTFFCCAVLFNERLESYRWALQVGNLLTPLLLLF
jgi:FAR1 DNA-binding domain